MIVETDPGFFSHAQAHIKTEAYGYAIADAGKAIELNPKLVKVCAPHLGA